MTNPNSLSSCGYQGEGDRFAAEQWRPVPGFERFYEVSSTGLVWSRRTEQILRGSLVKGYLNVRLTLKRKLFHRPIHRLVCQAFHGHCPPDKEMVGHLDGNSLNNHANNLAWITRSENTLHSIKHGTYNSLPPPPTSHRGEKHPMAKLTLQDVSEIKRRLAAGETRRPIAHDFGVSLTAISGIKTRKYWNYE